MCMGVQCATTDADMPPAQAGQYRFDGRYGASGMSLHDSFASLR